MKAPAPPTAPGAAAPVPAPEDSRYVLCLYLTGTTAQSTKAVVNIRKICEAHLQGRYELEIIDLTLHPTLAAADQIIAAPTLIKRLPLPARRFIGDMSETERILVGLDLRAPAG